MAEDRPRLRALEAFPVEQNGQRLHRPARSRRLHRSGRGPAAAAARPGLALRRRALDAARSRRSLERAPRRGARPSSRSPRSSRSLDDNGFLDSERFAERQRAIEEAFRQSPVRPAAHAGGAYAGEPEAPRGPDRRLLHPCRRARVAGEPRRVRRGRVAPRGSHRAAHRLPSGRADVRVGLSRADRALRRRPLRHPRHLPCGHGRSVRGHPQAVRHAARTGPGRSRLLRGARAALRGRPARLGGGAPHRALDRVPGGDAPAPPAGRGGRSRSCPCSPRTCTRRCGRGRDPEADPRVPRFIDALLETMAASGAQDRASIAGVDLAHVGPRFGDRGGRIRDASLGAVGGRRSEHARVGGGGRRPRRSTPSVAHDGDAGASAGFRRIYTFLRALPGVRGPPPPLQPVAGSRGRGDVLRRGLSVTAPSEPVTPGRCPRAGRCRAFASRATASGSTRAKR